jgi:nuclear pore complex protein Nup155
MEQEPWKAEVASFEQLYMLLSQTIEAISFVLLLVDYKMGDVVAG